MAGWFERVLGWQGKGVTERASGFGGVSSSSGSSSLSDLGVSSGLGDGVIGLPDGSPFFMLDVYRRLRDSIPDISDAVWTWKRLCQVGYDVQVVESSSEVAKERAIGLVRGFDSQVSFLNRYLYSSLNQATLEHKWSWIVEKRLE